MSQYFVFRAGLSARGQPLAPPLSRARNHQSIEARRWPLALAYVLALGFTTLVAAEPSTAQSPSPDQEDARPVAGIMDNSFLVEEAYNQEAGVVQHIVNVAHRIKRVPGVDETGWDLVFTQEWPVFSQTHQFGYTLPYAFEQNATGGRNGLGDMLLNYRFQAYYDEEHLRAIAPRFSLVLPTGDAARGFGDDTVGYQWNLPLSTAIGDRWYAHANAGLTYLPGAGPQPNRDLLHYHLGVSGMYAASRNLHFVLECVGYWQETASATAGWEHPLAALLSPGARYAVNFSNQSQLVLGVGIPIGLTEAAPDLGVFLYLSYEHRVFKAK